MHFDQQAVCSSGHCCLCHWHDHVAMTGAMTGICDDRQVGESVHHRNGAEIEKVPGSRIEAPYAALTQNDVRVSLSKNVLGREQQLLDGSREAALQENRLACATGTFE